MWKEDVEEDEDLAEFDDSEEEEDLEESSMTGDSLASSPSGKRSGSSVSRRLAERESFLSDDSDGAASTAVLYIQMLLCELTLRDWLRTEERRDTSLEANKPYFLQLLTGLQHIHHHKLIHRDLTPANVFLTADRRTIKIGDFGLSREMTSELPNIASMPANLAEQEALASASRAARRGDRREHMRSVTRGVGTTLYMSPEQRACQPYDHKVDIYSAGVLLLELCHPFDTGMERVVVLSNLQRHQLPTAMVGSPEGELILQMTHEDPGVRATPLAATSCLPHSHPTPGSTLIRALRVARSVTSCPSTHISRMHICPHPACAPRPTGPPECRGSARLPRARRARPHLRQCPPLHAIHPDAPHPRAD